MKHQAWAAVWLVCVVGCIATLSGCSLFHSGANGGQPDEDAKMDSGASAQLDGSASVDGATRFDASLDLDASTDVDAASLPDASALLPESTAPFDLVYLACGEVAFDAGLPDCSVYAQRLGKLRRSSCTHRQ